MKDLSQVGNKLFNKQCNSIDCYFVVSLTKGAMSTFGRKQAF